MLWQSGCSVRNFTCPLVASAHRCAILAFSSCTKIAIKHDVSCWDLGDVTSNIPTWHRDVSVRLCKSQLAPYQASRVCIHQMVGNGNQRLGWRLPVMILSPQTKIWEGWTKLTKDEMRISKEALFKGGSTRFGLRTIESPFENQELIFCSSFPNLRLGA